MNGTTSSTPAKRGRNPWPIAIIAYFIVFIGAMATWIVYASHQRMDLVRSDYYEKEILFQHQIDAANRARQAGAEVNVAYDFSRQSITVQLPADHQRANASGTIHFYRPSNAKLDHDVQLALDATGAQHMDARSLAPGLWKVHMSWRVNGSEYYLDRSLVVGSSGS